MARHPELALVGALDVDRAKADAFAAAEGCIAYATLDDLCADQPDIVVNLTSAPYHFATSRELIRRGQTVFCEKPLALSAGEARQLVADAEAFGVRLAGAPSLWLGAAQQAAAQEVLSGSIGRVGLVKAEVNQGRIETWHPAPGSFYQVGPVVDAGVYPLAYLTAVFGPISEVSALSGMSVPQRTTLAGDPFAPGRDDTWAVIGRFASGALLNLTCIFFVDSATQPRTVAFHGETGSVVLDDWFFPGSAVRRAEYGAPPTRALAEEDVPVDWSIGVVDLADAIREGRPHRNGAEHAAHIADVLDAIARSAETGERVAVSSNFPSPFSPPAVLETD